MSNQPQIYRKGSTPNLTPAASAVLSEVCWLRTAGSFIADRLGFFDRLASSTGRWPEWLRCGDDERVLLNSSLQEHRRIHLRSLQLRLRYDMNEFVLWRMIVLCL